MIAKVSIGTDSGVMHFIARIGFRTDGFVEVVEVLDDYYNEDQVEGRLYPRESINYIDPTIEVAGE